MGMYVPWGEEADQINWLSSKVNTAVRGKKGMLMWQIAFLRRLSAAVPLALWDCHSPKSC